ncbi:hypothetical protein JHK87_037270 [Glycine soja]|nr:hypothetical protein JHK87_037270 [Glycine soja]
MKKKKKKKHLHDGRTIALNPETETFLVIRIPDALVLRIVSRSLIVAMVLAALPFLGTVLEGFYFSSSFVPNLDTGSLDVGLLNSILHDFAEEGLLRENDKALIVNSPVPDIFREKIDAVMNSDWESKSLFADESYDFVFTSGAIDAEFIDRILKNDGIVALPLGTKSSNSAFKEQSNYKVVSLKRYGFVIVALKKTGPAIRLLVDSEYSSPKRKLLAIKTKTGLGKVRDMIDDEALGAIANFLGIFIFALVIAYHLVTADPKYEAS